MRPEREPETASARPPGLCARRERGPARGWRHAGRRAAWRCGAAACLLCATAHADTILSSKHDLSANSTANIRATTESEVCLFCHTPHRGEGATPLWNHRASTASYTPYSSSTVKATIGQPTGSSKLCLSCHDGTVALGMVNSRAVPIEMRKNVTTMPAGPSNLGTDLSDDHPISFVYDNALATTDGQLRDPTTLNNKKIRLDQNNQLQCTTCHDPHDNQYGHFLVQDNYASALCVQCHNLTFWQDSLHQTSTKTWNGSGPNPWPRGGARQNTVAANGCANCHTSHNAGTKQRLLNFAPEEKNCFSCHSGTVAAKDLQSEFNKFSTHPVLTTGTVHDPGEDPINAARHTACSDCHNPHATRTTSALAPTASGALAGVKGVQAGGAVLNAVTYEYELCFRCHADSVARGRARVNRQYSQTNTRIQFQTANASFHPVESVGKNPNVPSLIPPLTIASRIYCTDCHNNDQGPGAGGTGPNGPHGSIYPPILERQQILLDNNPETVGTYALCYKCHSRPSILGDDSFQARNSAGQSRGHRFHIVDQKTACTTCHDPHGVEQQAHLINFNRDYVTASANGRLEYLSSGPQRGQCSLTCHGVDHNAKNYGP